MKKVFYSLTSITLFALLFSTQISVSSCTKETIVHDTTTVDIHDTTIVNVHDTLWKSDLIAKHINDSLWAYYPIQGNANDSSGHNHTLVLNNGASLTYDKNGNDLCA